MKRLFAAALAAALMVSMAGCGSGKVDDMGNWDYKTGLATYTRTGASYGTSATGSDTVTSTIVAAVFDKDGKIVNISIDEVESRPGATGEIISKKELGDDYGMKAVSSIGKEWHQQVADLEKWLVGKDISRLVSNATGKMRQYTGADSRPSATADEYAMGNSDGSISGTVPGVAQPYSGNANSGSTNSGMANSAGGAGSSMANSGTIGGVVGDVMDGVNSAIDDMTDSGMNNSGTTAGMWMGEDLRAMVTIDTTNIRTAVEKAWRNAK